MTTMFGSAIPCRRAARFGVSPTIACSCAAPAPIRSPTTTSPVAMPTRVCRARVWLDRYCGTISFQPRAHRPLGVVLMRLRIAEVHQHAVAHVFRHEPSKRLHGFGDAFLICRNDLAHVLRVHAGGERRRTDQVREHHRDLAALGVGAWGGGVISREAGVCSLVPSAATALNSLSRAPSGRPSSRKCSSVRSRSTSASIALSRNVCAYCSRPIPRSQPSMSKFSPLGLLSAQFLKRIESWRPP